MFKIPSRSILPCLKDDDTLVKFVFVSFISLVECFKNLKLLKERNINAIISVKETLL